MARNTVDQMKRGVLIIATALLAGTASAKMYKCQSPDGSIAYQQVPCTGEATTHEIKPRSQSFGDTPGASAERIKRGYEALRTLRAKQLGITRKKLDAYEDYEPITYDENRVERGRLVKSGGRLKISESTGYHSSSGRYYIVEGIVSNTGSKPVRSATIKGKGLDTDGNLVQLEESSTDPTIVEPGRTATFRLRFNRGTLIQAHNLTIQH